MSTPKVGLFGLLGAGNIGNDGSLEALLAYLNAERPDAVLSCLCSGPEEIRSRFGIAATPLYWYYARPRPASPLARVALKAFGKIADPFRILLWVRRRDVVIVPGTGVLENTLPVRPWGFPYSLFLLCLAGRLTGTKVALVNVGASVVRQRSIRTLYRAAARMAYYRSYRDTLSRDAMSSMGVDTSGDVVYPDLVFALPEPARADTAARTVGVGVMDFHGSTDDWRQGAQIHGSYMDGMKCLVRWLVTGGHRVRLLIGDRIDEGAIAEILDDLRANCPGFEPTDVLAEPAPTLGELLRQVDSVELVIGTRYHNVVCALKLAKPTIAISYSAKSDHLMADMGVGEFCQPARSIDVDRLMQQFSMLEGRAEQIRRTLADAGRERMARIEHQYAVLTASLFPQAEPASGDPAGPVASGKAS